MTKYSYLRTILSVLFILFSHSFIHAQVLTLGAGTFTGSNFAGPANTSMSANAGSRYAYIFPATVLAGLRHGDTVRSLSFLRNSGSSISGNCNMKIFMRMTLNPNYGPKNINWVNLSGATGMKKVYDQNPVSDMGAKNGWVRFTFSTPYVVDTLFGQNLEVLVQYTHSSSQSDNIFWTFESSGTVNGYGANQVKFVSTNGGTLTDTTKFSMDLHPTIRIEFPRSDYDASVTKMYSLGKLPVPLGNPDSVRAIIQNVGKKAYTNLKVYLYSQGANRLVDSGTYSLGYLEEKILAVPVLYPSKTGLDTLIVKLGNDADTSNNRVSGLRIATTNIYSYKNPAAGLAGGIGFSGGTGDFVAKFYSNTKKAINQIRVAFAGSGEKFKLGIWKADGTGGAPGTNIWTSDTLVSSPDFITPVIPFVNVDGSFYVGVRQIGLNNVAFGYQAELPVRPNTFYYAEPTGSTNWIDFAPDAPYKFVIEPRLQAQDDVAPFSYDFPKDTIDLKNVVKMAPKATIMNYGSNDQLAPFSVTMNITRNNFLEYTSTKQDTLSSGRKHRLVFDSTFLPTQAGDYLVTVITKLSGDQLKDNDTFKTKFTIAVYQDVGPAIIFDPSPGIDYEQFVDTIYPTVFIQNYGLDKQTFSVTAEIYDSLNNKIYSDVKSYTLTPLNSVLASFKVFPCDVLGSYRFRAFTSLFIDVDKSNDTTIWRDFKIVRSNDVAVTAIIYPEINKSLNPPVAPKKPNVIVECLGDANQATPFYTYCIITYNQNIVYKDSVQVTSFRTIPTNVFFKNFQPVAKGYYHMQVYTSLSADQFRANDTMTGDFAVGVPDDIELLSVSPAPGDKLQLSQKYPASFTIRNNGYNPQNTPFPVVFMVRQGASIKYIKIVNITLDSAETKTVTIDTTLSLSNDQPYDVLVYSSLSKDFIKSNDTIRGIYTGMKSYDVGVTAILYPTSRDTLLLNTGNVEPLVVVKNLGDSLVKDKFRTVIKIALASNGALIYQKFIDTAVSDSIVLKFPSFSVSGLPQGVTITAYTDYANDQFHTNDTAREISRFMVKYDAASTAVTTPADLAVFQKTSAAIMPAAKIANKGVVSLVNFYARLRIMRVDTPSGNETEVYRDSAMVVSIAPGVTQNVNFTKSFTFSDKQAGVYKCYLDHQLAQDQVFANNLLTTKFSIESGVGIGETVVVGFNLYPNPGNGIFKVETSLPGPLDYEVQNVNGKLIHSGRLPGGSGLVDLRHLSDGTYFLKIGNEVIKVIVAH